MVVRCRRPDLLCSPFPCPKYVATPGGFFDIFFFSGLNLHLRRDLSFFTSCKARCLKDPSWHNGVFVSDKDSRISHSEDLLLY